MAAFPLYAKGELAHNNHGEQTCWKGRLIAMDKQPNKKTPINLTPELEKFKYEVAQEIGIAGRKHKNAGQQPQQPQK